MRPNRLSRIWKSSMNTVLFLNATIGFSENLFLVFIIFSFYKTVGVFTHLIYIYPLNTV